MGVPKNLTKYEGQTGEIFFHEAGRCKAKILRDRAGQGLGQSTYCVYQLIEVICYSKGCLDLHCVKFS